MSESDPNLFNALFDFRPREGHTAKENFLSEGFAYVLRTSKLACDAWLSEVLKRRVETKSTKIHTRNSERFGDTVLFPDMLIEAELTDGTLEIIYSEHKWEADCDPNQLQNYFAIAKQRRADSRVVFIGRTLEQRRVAAGTHLGAEKAQLDGCFLWEEVYEILVAVPEPDAIFRQFLGFMKTHGLNPGVPLSPSGLLALVEAPKAKLGLDRAIERLREMNLSLLPPRFLSGPRVEEKWGSLYVVLATSADWRPALVFGFLLTPVHYGVGMTKPAKGIDLMLRLAANPERMRSERIRPALTVLSRKQPELKSTADSVLLIGDEGNSSRWSLLMVQRCLAEVIGDAQTELEQHESIRKLLNHWLTILFGDGVLEAALLDSGLDGSADTSNAEIALTSSPPACANSTPPPAAA